MADINKIQEERARTLQKIEELENRIQRVGALNEQNQEKLAEYAKKLNYEREQELKKLEKQENYIKQITDEIKAQTDAIEDQNEVIEEQIDLYKSISSEIKSSIESLKVLDVATKKVQDSASKFGRSFQAALSAANKMGDDVSISLLGDMQNAFTDFEEAVSSGDLSQFEAKWGNDIVARFMEDLKTLPPQIQQLVGQSLEAFGEMQKSIGINMGLTAGELDVLKELTSEADELQERFEALGNQISVMIQKPEVAIGLAVAGIGVLLDKIGEVNSSLGMSLTSMNGFTLSASALSFFFDDAADTAKKLAEELGSMDKAGFNVQLSTNLLAKNLGISGEEAAGLVGTFSRLNGGSTDVANNMIVSVRETAKLKGVIPNQVMSDLAESADAFALYSKDGGENLAEAAIYARQLGTSLDTISGIADDLLDFESSITKELELSAMLGRSINLNRARELAYAGDLEGMQRELLNQLGGIDEFNRMDYFQKKSTAELLGVSVGELQKMLQNSENATGEVSLLNEEFSAINESITAAANNLAGGFFKTLSAGIVLVGQMGDGFKTLGNVGSGVFNKLKGFFGKGSPTAAAANTISQAAQTAQGVSQTAGGAAGSIAGTVTPGPGGGKAPGGGIMESVSKIDMNKALKGAAAMVIVAGAVFVFGKAVQEFMKVSWEAVGMAVVSMLALVGAVTLLGMIMTSGVGAVAILAGAAAMLVIAASVLVLGHALQSIGKGFEMMTNGISNLMPQLKSVTTTISSMVALVDSITSLSGSILGLAGSLIALGVAGVLATPGLMALSVVGAVSTGLTTMLGGEEEGGGREDSRMGELLGEIRGLREDMASGKIAVYMDGKKVTAGITKVVTTSGQNSYVRA